MENKRNLLLNISILYRNTLKYLDVKLEKYNIGSGQLNFLLLINENEGINSNHLCKIGEYDKSTSAKSIRKLEIEGYIEVIIDEKDRRSRKLYTTAKSNKIMTELYEIRNIYYEIISKELDMKDLEGFSYKMALNSEEIIDESNSFESIKIGGLQKLTLLDYPDKVACTIFLGGCNYKCPFCHNKDLVFMPEGFELYEVEEIMSYLNLRKGVLDGVVISGGEPLLQESTIDFIKEIKSLGYNIKLDTNGNYPDKLIYLLENGYVDYVAVDIKNSKEKYAQTIGLNESAFDLSNIQKTISFLLKNDYDYEFRTTVVSEFHDLQDFEKIVKWIKGAKKYYLQPYRESENVIKKGLHTPTQKDMELYKNTVKKHIANTEIRNT
jgi:anaerobic ribonucleoside-triphosphate reductase activating protein